MKNELINLMILIFGGVLFAPLKAVIDMYQINKGLTINKPLEICVMLLITIPFSIYFAHDMHEGYYIIISGLFNQAIGMLSFWIIFDPIMGKVLVGDARYVGTTSILDENAPKKYYTLNKIIVLAMLIGFYYGLIL